MTFASTPQAAYGRAAKRLREKAKGLGEGDREKKLEEALHTVLGCCQEVAHEVEDPTHACAEIEGVARNALAALPPESQEERRLAEGAQAQADEDEQLAEADMAVGAETLNPASHQPGLDAERERDEWRARYRQEKKRRKKAESAAHHWRHNHDNQVRRKRNLSERFGQMCRQRLDADDRERLERIADAINCCDVLPEDASFLRDLASRQSEQGTDD